MRVAFITWSNRVAGGAEQYTASIAEYLTRAGHEIALWHETNLPEDRPPIPLPHGTCVWDATHLNLLASIEALQAWRPDVVYCQGLLQPDTETLIQKIAPSVFFAHDYKGICISGGRTLSRPALCPCPHAFSPRCLARYYPNRCGGLNPLTMIRDYRTNVRRMQALAAYTAVISHSNWVSSEYNKHGIGCRRVRFFTRLEVNASNSPLREGHLPWRLLMMGRMTANKGGEMLLDAIPRIAATLKHPISLTFAGDGPARKDWEAKASAMQVRDVDIRFTGWLSGSERGSAFASADLMVLPSIWPEPWGMIGLEAGQYGVPAAAFAVGGIPDWLKEGVNGCLAPGDRLTARNLADAVVRCLWNRDRYAEMRRRSREMALSMTIDQHYSDLMQVFHDVLEPAPHRRTIPASERISTACSL